MNIMNLETSNYPHCKNTTLEEFYHGTKKEDEEALVQKGNFLGKKK